MTSYKKAYQLYKRAYSWDEFKADAGKAWKGFNDYADKNDWVRPATYGLGGAALGSLGFLSDNLTGSATTAAGGIIGTLAGLGHNSMSAADRRAAAKKIAQQEASRKAGQWAQHQNRLNNPKPDAQISGPGYGSSIDATSAGLAGGGGATLVLAKILKDRKAKASSAGASSATGPTPPSGTALVLAQRRLPAAPEAPLLPQAQRLLPQAPSGGNTANISLGDIKKLVKRKGSMPLSMRKDIDALSSVGGNLLRLNPSQRKRVMMLLRRVKK